MEQNTTEHSNQGDPRDKILSKVFEHAFTYTGDPMKVVIIDPTSPEVNRGSFCYLPYIVYNSIALKQNAWLMEDFTITQIDSIPEAENYLVALWSYPQIDLCLMLNKFLPKQPIFFGYTPLIKHLKLRHWYPNEQTLIEGIYNYPQCYASLKHLLLSDCDMHLTKYEGQVYPLFTSYGCPRGCAFCPSTVNCGRKRTVIPIQAVRTMLDHCIDREVNNIHFTDEDFFFDHQRAFEILNHAARLGGFNFIALGEVTTVNRFINYHGNEVLTESGVKLIEVGMETADPDLGKKMGKAPVDKCKELSEKCQVDIFWLALTFFPGETLKTLNETGQFLRRHGFHPEELYGRVRTNGTEGGLGQFFQPYHGTKDYSQLKKRGKFISSRPMRLIPSYLPNSFLSQLVKHKQHHEDIKYYCDLYRLPDIAIPNSGTIWENIRKNFKEGYSMADSATFYAILARLGVI
jgi:hypothetical protein